VIVYRGAVHSFDLEISRQEHQGHLVGYDQAAAVDSHQQMVTFFSSQLSGDMKASMPVMEQMETPVIKFLSGLEIQQLIPSGKLKSINAYGNPYTISYTPDGVISGVAGKAGEYRDNGKWWVTGDNFCRQYESWLDGKAACFKVSLEGDAISFFDTAGNFVSSGSFLQ